MRLHTKSQLQGCAGSVISLALFVSGPVNMKTNKKRTQTGRQIREQEHSKLLGEEEASGSRGMGLPDCFNQDRNREQERKEKRETDTHFLLEGGNGLIAGKKGVDCKWVESSISVAGLITEINLIMYWQNSLSCRRPDGYC